MSLGLNDKTKYHFVDDNNMVLNRSDIDFGKHDSIERTLHSYLAYGDMRFLDGIDACLQFDGSGDAWQRYPVAYAGMKPISRDHIFYAICCMKYAEFNYHAKAYAKHLPIKISKGTYQDLKMWLWLKLICNSRIGYLFYPYELVDLFIRTWLNVGIRKLFKIEEEWNQVEKDWKHDWLVKYSVKDYSKMYYKKLPAKLLFPTYALKINAFMLDVLPESAFKRLIKRVTHPIVPKYNYLLQMLLDTPNQPTWEDIMSYQPMTGDRWSQELNPQINNLDTKIITDKKLLGANELDKDLIIAIYKRKHNLL